jgi:hypothetical protein
MTPPAYRAAPVAAVAAISALLLTAGCPSGTTPSLVEPDEGGAAEASIGGRPQDASVIESAAADSAIVDAAAPDSQPIEAGFCTPGSPATPPIVTIPADLTFNVSPPNDIALGSGYDTATQNLLPGQPCVAPLQDAGTAPPPPPKGDAGCTTSTLNQVFTMHLYRSYEDLVQSQSLGFSASIGDPTGLWSADLFASYLQQQQSTQESVYLLVEDVVTLQQPAVQFALTDYGTCLLRADPTGNRFLQQCGDRFVSSVVRGTSFRAVLKGTNSTSLSTSVMQIGGRANAAGSFSLSGDFATDVQNFVSTYGLDIQVVQTGGTNIVVSTSPDDLITQAESFACGSSTANSYVTGITVTSNLRAAVQAPYDVIVPAPTDVSTTLGQLTKLYATLSETQQLFNWMVSQHQTEWRQPACSGDGGADGLYQQKLGDVQAAMNAISQALAACESGDPSQLPACSVPTIDTASLAQLPIIEPAECLGGPCTGYTAPGEGRDAYGICISCINAAGGLPSFHQGDAPMTVQCTGMLPGAPVTASLSSGYVIQSPPNVGCGTDLLGTGMQASLQWSTSAGNVVSSAFNHSVWSSGTNDYCSSGLRPNASQQYSADGSATGTVGYDGSVTVDLGVQSSQCCGRECCVNDTGNAWTNGECVFQALAVQICEGSCAVVGDQ